MIIFQKNKKVKSTLLTRTNTKYSARSTQTFSAVRERHLFYLSIFLTGAYTHFILEVIYACHLLMPTPSPKFRPCRPLGPPRIPPLIPRRFSFVVSRVGNLRNSEDADKCRFVIVVVVANNGRWVVDDSQLEKFRANYNVF